MWEGTKIFKDQSLQNLSWKLVMTDLKSMSCNCHDIIACHYESQGSLIDDVTGFLLKEFIMTK